MTCEPHPDSHLNCGTRGVCGIRRYHWHVACLVLVGLMLAMACADEVPSASESISSAEQSLGTAIHRLEEAVAALEEANEADRGGTHSLVQHRFDADILYLIVLLSEIAVELEIAERLIDPEIDRIPRPWPLTAETAVGLGTAQRRLDILLIQLHRQRDRLVRPPTSDTQLELAASLANSQSNCSHCSHH